MTSNGLLETQLMAKGFVDGLEPGRRAVVVALFGDLGSGKTSFTQGAAAALGVKDAVQSPTYVIAKSYKAVHPRFKKLVHIDAYRLEEARELARLGWDDMLSDPSSVIFIEWPERVEELLPPDARKVRFRFVDESVREIDFEHGEAY